ncbi:hypothetical protein B296_00053403, partial [Ensete ventricosum]
SYKHTFAKKYDAHKLRSNFALVEFRSIFHTLFRKFKILASNNVLAHGKSFEHGFRKKCDGHKLCAVSSFDRFFVLRLGNSKYLSFPSY